MPENSHDTSGTPGYMAPEVICRQNHGVAADYFAVGVIAFECMLGRRPYQGKTRRDIRDQILARQAAVKLQDLPRGWSLDAADFINRVKDCMMIVTAEKTFVKAGAKWASGGKESSVAKKYRMERLART
eukprot:TRINITY_DN9757_c0_g1_i2.p3 TRINITY_DN9757_c0_g1~~TRINITY_DN9757_c0_g1_i2.p3  ORF type:complete len:129 (-),score=22.50 TRINITY_DN9757_c0_g1_i2:226-612(-)